MAVSVPDTSPRGASVPDTAPVAEVPDTKPAERPARRRDRVSDVAPRDRNGRVVSADQALGVELPDGRVVPIPEENRHLAQIGGRVLDTTPWSGYPIVVLS